MATKKEERESPAFYYVCEHQASNDPCPEGCHGRGAPAMPDDWQKKYKPPTS